MRSDDDILHAQKRMTGGERFLLEDVECRAGDDTGLQGLRQGFLVHDATAGTIHQTGGLLHRAQTLGIDELLRLR